MASKAVRYVGLAIGLVVLAWVVLEVVSAIVSFVTALLTLAVTLLVLAVLGYVLLKGIGWLRSDGAGADRRDGISESADRTARQQTVDGEFDGHSERDGDRADGNREEREREGSR